GLRGEVSEQDSDDHSAQHLKIEMLIKLLLRRRRRRMCLRHAYLHSHQARAVALGPSPYTHQPNANMLSLIVGVCRIASFGVAITAGYTGHPPLSNFRDKRAKTLDKDRKR